MSSQEGARYAVAKEKGKKDLKKQYEDKVLEDVFKNMEITESVYDFFDGITTGDEVERKKPFPDIYLNVINKLKLKPSECMAIEDSSAGVESAKPAGCLAVGLLTPFNSKKTLSNADKVVNSLKDIIQENFWGWFDSKFNEIYMGR